MNWLYDQDQANVTSVVEGSAMPLKANATDSEKEAWELDNIHTLCTMWVIGMKLRDFNFQNDVMDCISAYELTKERLIYPVTICYVSDSTKVTSGLGS